VELLVENLTIMKILQLSPYVILTS